MSTQDSINLIEKQRYLIPCKCKICKKGFQDLMIGQRHVYEDHKDREKPNIIDNLIWNVDDDIKKYHILKKLERERNLILKKLIDEKELEGIKIPNSLKIRTKTYELNSFIDSVLDKEKKPDDKTIKEYKKDLDRQFSNYEKAIKKVSMGKEVQNVLKNKKTSIQSLEADVKKYLILKKANSLIPKPK